MTCACGHAEGDHRSAGTSYPHPPQYGVCLVPRCTCSAYTTTRNQNLTHMRRHLTRTLPLAAVLAAALTGTARADIYTPSLPCLTAGRVAAIRADPSAVARIYDRACAGQVERAVPFARLPVGRHTVFAALVAYRMAPYGYSTTTTPAGMLRARRLNCGNYGYLTAALVRAGWGDRHAAQLRQSGWDGGLFGNHAQLHVGHITVDPTIAAVAQVTFGQLVRGQGAARVEYFGGHRERGQLLTWDMSVLRALDAGAYRPGQLLYRRAFA